MSEETSTESHLSVVMTTNQDEMTQTTGVTSSSSHGSALYFECFVVVIGIIGTAANGLVLYALVASKQHKKHELIVSQNALDLYCCLILVITYAVRLANIHLTGSLGYWLCMFISSESLLISGLEASTMNLTFIAIERYLKVVHPKWSKKKLRKWMTYVAVVFALIYGFVNNMAVVFETSVVINGVCYGFVIWKNLETKWATAIYYWFSSYFAVILIFVFCYGKILMAIRRQARVMASHGEAGSSTAQTQLNNIQNNVIKTMIFVCSFFAIAWLPEKIFVLLIGLGVYDNFLDNGYYVALFLAFLYICTNVKIITMSECFQKIPGPSMLHSGRSSLMCCTTQPEPLYICTNPFIYATKFDPVRRILKGLILCKDVSEPVSGGMQMT